MRIGKNVSVLPNILRPHFESCIWRPVSFHSFHHPQEVLLAQFSIYVHKGGLNPISLVDKVTYCAFYN